MRAPSSSAETLDHDQNTRDPHGADPYAARFSQLVEGTLWGSLDQNAREFIRQIACRHHFTFQELRAVCQAERDLAMWRVPGLAVWWQAAVAAGEPTTRAEKKALLRRLDEHMTGLAREEKRYVDPPLAGSARGATRLEEKASGRAVMGRCPVYSERTICCGLYTVDAVLGCPFSCSYCTIQTFYPEVAEADPDLAAKLAALNLPPNQFAHLGTGQASDSLAWGNAAEALNVLCEFAAKHPAVLLELKTKSDQIEPLLRQGAAAEGSSAARAVPPNIAVSWSLNTEAVISNEEHGTAPLERRLWAARRAADHGVAVGFHFHPLVVYQGWREDYAAVVAQLLELFRPEEVAFVSLGTMTMIRPVAQAIRRRGGETKVLQMELVPDPHGKLTYPQETKIELFQHLYRLLQPWQVEVFIYLCMEPEAIWRAVFGRSYASSTEFEAAFGQHWGAFLRSREGSP